MSVWWSFLNVGMCCWERREEKERVIGHEICGCKGAVAWPRVDGVSLGESEDGWRKVIRVAWRPRTSIETR